MGKPLEWVRVASGEWWLFDKPRGTPRHPVASISGIARIGYHGSLRGSGGNAAFHGRTIPAVKRQIEATLDPTACA